MPNSNEQLRNINEIQNKIKTMIQNTNKELKKDDKNKVIENLKKIINVINEKVLTIDDFLNTIETSSPVETRDTRTGFDRLKSILGVPVFTVFIAGLGEIRNFQKKLSTNVVNNKNKDNITEFLGDVASSSFNSTNYSMAMIDIITTKITGHFSKWAIGVLKEALFSKELKDIDVITNALKHTEEIKKK